MSVSDYFQFSILNFASGIVALIGMALSAGLSGLLFVGTQKLKSSEQNIFVKSFLCLVIAVAGWIVTGAGIVLFCRETPFIGGVVRQMFEIAWLNFVFIWTLPKQGTRIVIPFLALYLSLEVLYVYDFLFPLRGEDRGSITSTGDMLAALAVIIAGVVSYSQISKLTSERPLQEIPKKAN